MHLGAGVIERRNAEEGVVFLLSVVILFHNGGVHKTRVGVKDRLGESGRARGEVDRAVIVIFHFHFGCCAGVVGGLRDEVLREGRAAGSVIQKQSSAGNVVCDLLNTSDEFRSEDQNIRFCEFDTVFDLVSTVSEIEGDGNSAGLEDTKIDRQPVQTIHKKDRDLVALDDSAGDQHIGHTVCLFIEDSPGDLLAAGNFVKGLDQFKFFPGRESGDLDVGI